MKRISCVDLPALEVENELHPRKRISQLRHRSLSAADLARKARVDEWIAELYDTPQPQDELSTLLQCPTTTPFDLNAKGKDFDAGMQLELLNFWQHSWLHDATVDEAPRLC
ncbi:hypothetical protein SPRG_05487 [Saprolegnia parasitica CBS 223.65]|uniref:Uncharacterized protein n=1 Tax=Saprolegnia parasitica (strain CBS 223.65) TaxID=695850 RepID=A0A067CSL6_SAPPC|nr:hypothetical protein SPRG_05487 [Saprolegnia parasitica CBS 223.65]KDO29531.1 hypothetical protein SPRG_05487 [Saprolegnia parasitica CBS 223.65]|eukprot:XP_012199596.1 hypothetical protein SPRG_05487 [Saprolegnia parasitica CBS 223.65]